jgi:L,D-peptidoglycan transpeptidase YkuD (ErfK/YbiS/YcfS/YnhG family)
VKAGSTKLTVKYGKQKLVVPVTVSAEQAPPQGSAAAALEVANQTDQIVLVDYTGGSKAVLSLHEKVDGIWTEVLSCDAYVGKNGIGKTKAGDKKTPEGTYNLTTPFGIKDDPGAQMPYTKVTKYHYWCGDSNSEYYNKLVDERKVDRKHTKSDEYLIDYKGVYNYCLFIDYNAEGIPNKGSCIFLHCTGKNKYTAGCVAVPEKTMKQIVQWARAGVKIVIRES